MFLPLRCVFQSERRKRPWTPVRLTLARACTGRLPRRGGCATSYRVGRALRQGRCASLSASESGVGDYRAWRDGDASKNREGADDEQDLSGAIFERGDRQHHVIGIGRIIDASNPQGVRRAGPGQRHEGNQDNKKAEQRHTNAPTMDVIGEHGEGLAWQASQWKPPRHSRGE